ncbi:MAG: hypothetical protein ACLGIF_04320, partial [Actinomycetes bacterium]
ELDLHQLGYWLLVTAVFLAAPFLIVRRPSAHLTVAARLGHLVGPALDRFRDQAEPAVDEDLAEALHKERLRSDLLRLRRLLATDMSMSATRQQGNRLAYARLLEEARKTAEFTRLVDPTRADSGAGFAARAAAANWGRSLPPAPGHSVEILDIGWRDRRRR